MSIDYDNAPPASATIHYNSSSPGKQQPDTSGQGGTNPTPPGGAQQNPPAAAAPDDAKALEAAGYAPGSTPGTASLTEGDKNTTKAEIDTIEIAGKTYTVTAVADGAFTKCKNLKTVKFTGTTAPSIAKNAFKGSGVKEVIVSKQLKKNKAFLKAIQAAGIKVKKLS